MLINETLGIGELASEDVNIFKREAVRAVIRKDNKILMVYCNRGDYKFPGGGVNRDEKHGEALKREVEEETGYFVSEVSNKIGIVIERRKDEYKKDSIFEMTSHYYLCNIQDKQVNQSLDEYEAELEFSPVWIDIEEAINKNEEILRINSSDKSDWVHRETMILKALREKGGVL